ncbi:MAG: YggS family pyridoxal phosphate-dependent enzyme [Cardiobacteriales bacterium]|nr:MAG: YggS family pyridoxal phosphate-dependent enzyme [Cardiobacteriales bacterium]
MQTQKCFLFSYATPQQNAIQNEIFGRLLQGEPDILSGYTLSKIPVSDSNTIHQTGKDHYPIALKSDDANSCIKGIIFEISEAELAAVDKYKGHNYQRIIATFASGRRAWVYIAKSNNRPSTIAANIHDIKMRIKIACEHSNRNPDDIRLLLATKTVTPSRIKEAFACGETLIGENKVQEVIQKYADLQAIPHQQHFIGHLQTNKVKEILKYNISCIQSLDRMSLAEKLQRQLGLKNQTMEVLIQINTSDEESKFGLSPHDALDFIRKVATFNTLKIKGLMTIGLFSTDHDKIRACFKRLKAIQQEVIKANIPNVEMQEMSMGMSGDLEIAIEEGATIIRVGTAIFGQRQYPDSYYWNESNKID